MPSHEIVSHHFLVGLYQYTPLCRVACLPLLYINDMPFRAMNSISFGESDHLDVRMSASLSESFAALFNFPMENLVASLIDKPWTISSDVKYSHFYQQFLLNRINLVGNTNDLSNEELEIFHVAINLLISRQKSLAITFQAIDPLVFKTLGFML